MKKAILLLLVLFALIKVNAQNPDITGDTMLCPNTNGTAYVIDPIYDSYQWFYKYWFTSDEFVPIEGATESVFVYDWYTYDQALLKVLVMLNGQTYESDTLQIDSYAWLPIYTSYELGNGVTFDPATETFILEQGAEFPVSINNPPYDTLIQWYRDGDSIDGADSSTYVITDAGTYWATAAPSFCPASISTTLPMVVVLAVKVPDIEASNFRLYPNPASDKLYIELTDPNRYNSLQVLDITGRVLFEGTLNSGQTVVSLDGYKAGLYYIKLIGEQGSETRAFVRY